MLTNRNFFFNRFNTVLAALLIFGFIYFQKRINTLVENYLTADPSYNRWYFKLLITSFYILIMYRIIMKLAVQRYIPSKNEYVSAGILFSVALFYRLDLNGAEWNLHEIWTIKNYGIRYLDLVLLAAAVFLLSFVSFIIPTCEKSKSKNFLLADDPIENEVDDELDYKTAAKKLAGLLIHENYDKSISAGLIGPWGNGKSSVIEMTRKIVEETEGYKKNDIITLHFLPYLNHSENDIINEFFTALSNKLQPYSGKLADQITDYAAKLTDLYQNKSINGFLENQIANFSKYSATELYQNINETLRQGGRKIIVFVDDLDRLSQNEILQTLKLIRNTANFHNTIFVVAMDKDYIIKRLAEDRNILDTKFIDKFFQLEIYLPLIDSMILKKYFIHHLSLPFSPSPPDFAERVKAAVSHPGLLFDDYVKNFRDAKRAINQIKFEITLFQEDFSYLNLKDFINFIFLKLKFPELVTQLNRDKGEYLSLKSNQQTYNLIKKSEKAVKEDLLNLLDNESINSIKQYSRYKIFKKIIKTESLKSNSLADTADRKLMIRSLAHLFGEENKIEGLDSIKYPNNFQMLMEQRIFSNYLKQSEFDGLYSLTRYQLKEELERIHKEDKIRQLLGRLTFFKTKDHDQIKLIIEYLVIIYEKYGLYGRFDSDTYNLLDKFAHLLQSNWHPTQGGDYSDWLNDSIFNQADTATETRLMLLGSIWKLKSYNQMWHLTEEFLTVKTQALYQEHLMLYQNVLWGVNNYEVPSIYHHIKEIAPQEINQILKAFWIRNRIELLCAQFTELSSSSNSRFKISNNVIHIFGSKNLFIEFIAQHNDAAEPQILEYLELYKLLEITDHTLEIEFDFEHSQLMLERIKYWRETPGRENYDDYKRPIQAIVKISDEVFGKRFISNSSWKDRYLLKSFIHKKHFYLLLNLFAEDNNLRFTEFINDVFELHDSSGSHTFTKKKITAPQVILDEGKLIVEIISIIPTNQEIVNLRHYRP